MRGLIFTEFLEMVEEEYDYPLVDDIIRSSSLPNDGAYTSVGVYPHQELFQLIDALSNKLQVEKHQLIMQFGELLFPKFVKSHPMYVNADDSVFSILAKLEDFIHVEVKKLHPESELPTFETLHHTDDKLILLYKSKKGLAPLAHGLINGCIRHFKENIEVATEDLTNSLGQEVQFTLTKTH